MGVYATVHVCLQREGGPLDAASRRAIVEGCVAAGLFGGPSVVTRAREPSLGSLEALRHRLTGWWPFRTLGEWGIQSFPHAPGPASREFERVWEGDASGLVASLADQTAFLVTSEGGRWKGAPLDGVALVALEEPVAVRTFDAYAAEPHPFAEPDVGEFHDVLTLTSRSAIDGRTLASSSLLRGWKKDLGVRATCRASHH